MAIAIGAEQIRVEKLEDVGPALTRALSLRKPFVLEIVCDGTQLAPHFRKDALQMPTRLLPKYQHLDMRNW